MKDIFSDIVSDDLEKLSEIFNPVDKKTADFEEGENRTVSILFLDVKGFTAMSEKMSSEDVKRIMDKILTALSNSILKFGGYIDKYEGDLIMALFGSRITSETDTQRAIDAGLKILSDLKHINKILNIELSVRIGINTGEVTTGRVGMKREGDFTVYGDAVNLASRMESNAPLNSIMLPRETKDIVEDYFIFEDLGIIEVKGKEKPVSVFKVVSRNPQKVERWERSLSIIKRSHYVGRESEINSIITLLNTSKDEIGSSEKEYKPVIIGVRGPAGIGKSRLVKESVERCGGSLGNILSGYTISYAQPSYFVWTTMLKKFFKIDEDDTKVSIRYKLDRVYEGLISLTGSDNELLKAKNVIGFMFGVEYEDSRLENCDPDAFQAMINISVRVTVEAVAYRLNIEDGRPLIIYLDDCQWMDEPSLKLFRNLITAINAEEKRSGESNKNLVIIMTFRPEFEKFRELDFDSRYHEFELNPLTAQDSGGLINSLLGDNDLSEPFINKISSISSGNPFYIEELVNYLIENEKIIMKNNRWSVSGETDLTSVPLSLNSVILSRIDNLDESRKSLLQRASVIGHHFYKNLLKEVSRKVDEDYDIDDDFKKLVGTNWIYPENDEDKFCFRHILTTDVCYNTILRYNKKILHRLIAVSAEDLFGDNKEYFAFIAGHYEKSEPEPGTHEYKMMLEYLEKAADIAKDNFENDTALGYFRSLADKYETPLIKKIQFKIKIGQILELTGKWNEAGALFSECISDSESINDPFSTAVSLRASGGIFWKKGDLKEAMRLFEKALKIFEHTGNRKETAVTYRNIGLIYRVQGEYAKSLDYFEKDLRIHESEKDDRGISGAIGNFGLIYSAQGDFEKAMECYRKQLIIFEKLGDRHGIIKATGNMGIVHRNKGEYDKAVECFEKCLNFSETIGDKQGVSKVAGNIGIIHMFRGDYSKAMENFETELKIATELGDKQTFPRVYGNIGIIHRKLGDFDKAMYYYGEQLRLSRELNDKRGICIAEGNMGIIHGLRGNFQEAMKCYHTQLTISEELKDRRGISASLGNIATNYLYTGDYDKAREYIEKDISISEGIGDKTEIAYGYKLLSDIKKRTGKYKDAVENYKRAIALDRELDLKPHLQGSLHGLADTYFRMNNFDKTSEILEEIFGISAENRQKDVAFQADILKIKNDFMKAGGLKEKLDVSELLKQMQHEQNDEENSAYISYELALMLRCVGQDFSEHKDNAIKFYKQKYLSVPKIEYKNIYEELESL